MSEGQVGGDHMSGSQMRDKGKEPAPTQKYVSPGPVRLRRLRFSPGMRALVRETNLLASELVYPLFVRPGVGIKKPIVSMPGQFQWSPDTVVEEARAATERGVPAVILFGIPDFKDSCGSGNLDPDGPVPSAARALKKELPELVVISDMCLCEYTEHGHCGAVNLATAANYRPDLPEGYLLNDPTLELLGRASVVHASAGADAIEDRVPVPGPPGAVGPADVMDLVVVDVYVIHARARWAAREIDAPNDVIVNIACCNRQVADRLVDVRCLDTGMDLGERAIGNDAVDPAIGLHARRRRLVRDRETVRPYWL